MSGAHFVTCSRCQRLMLGQTHGGQVYPQPHECVKEAQS